ncbi:T6SS immunity protein Tdi1 domain-containing protein [Arthrobacter sp. 35W]|uniref:T6SS immunity protein Tdi1 domain-containing protein n=1 Tax=Arthrobacter sp. 35W TaxID=1132441 RepID=UPI0004139EF3|nr:T6SS immunity protein Tdi1 domain-containing protein [Arthrobacter sp. 35W]
MLNPGTGEVTLFRVSFSDFHDLGLPDNADLCLDLPRFSEWISAAGTGPAFRECVGFKILLFQGGEDSVANLELSDLEVYWPLMGQLRMATKDLHVGTPISGVSIQEECVGVRRFLAKFKRGSHAGRQA